VPSQVALPSGTGDDTAVPPFAAIVLAGSYGWGAGHIPGLPPRPLALVALQPLISYSLEWIRGAGGLHATICANGSSRVLIDALGDRFDGVRLTYETDPIPRGPAGCILDAANHSDLETLLVVEGTIVPHVDLPQLLRAHRRADAALTVVTSDAADGLAAQAAGIYVMSRRALWAIAPRGYQDLKETTIPALHRAAERILHYPVRDACARVSDLDTYVAVNHALVERLAAHGLEAADPEWVSGPGMVAHRSARIDSDVRCIGPVLIGPQVHVSGGAVIIGPSVIAAGSRIDSGSLVSRSIVGMSCRIGAGAVVHGCVLGEQAVVDANESRCHALELRRPVPRRWLGRLLAPSGATADHAVPGSAPGAAPGRPPARVAPIVNRGPAS
jgi:NDP-sugar pyrophosphorylase family protein